MSSSSSSSSSLNVIIIIIIKLLTSGPETEAVLVRAPPEHRGSERLQGRPVVEHQVDVITWKRRLEMYNSDEFSDYTHLVANIMIY